MAEQGNGKGNNQEKNGKKTPLFRQRLTIGQKAADRLARWAGSWVFIFSFFLILVSWVALNVWLLQKKPFDPYPFILLNLFLSTLAALQAPIILMAQNRQAERDRVYARYDYTVNRRADRNIQKLQKDITWIKEKLARR